MIMVQPERIFPYRGAGGGYEHPHPPNRGAQPAQSRIRFVTNGQLDVVFDNYTIEQCWISLLDSPMDVCPLKRSWKRKTRSSTRCSSLFAVSEG